MGERATRIAIINTITTHLCVVLYFAEATCRLLFDSKSVNILRATFSISLVHFSSSHPYFVLYSCKMLCNTL